MILVDSNILIDYYRDRNSELAKKIDSMQIGICGVVKSEVLHGAKNYAEVDNILASFNSFASEFGFVFFEFLLINAPHKIY